MGLGQRAHGGAGHYEWFASNDWEHDPSDAQKAKIDKNEGTIIDSVLLLPKRKQQPRIRRDDSTLESFEDYKPKAGKEYSGSKNKEKLLPTLGANKSKGKAPLAERKSKANQVKLIGTVNSVPVHYDKTKNRKPKNKDSRTAKSIKEKPKKINTAILAPILTPMVKLNQAWIVEDGTKVLLVDLNSIKSSRLIWSRRMELLVTLGKKADHVFITGPEDLVRYAKNLTKELNVEAMISSIPNVSNKYLLGEVSKLREDRLQIIVFSNAHALSQLSGKGRLTIASQKVETMSRILAENADAIIDLVIEEEAVFDFVSKPEDIVANHLNREKRKDSNLKIRKKRSHKDSRRRKA